MRRIQLGSEFIHFFVDDMLDYTVLKNKEQNFSKNEGYFDVKLSVQEIVEMQEDRLKLKDICIHTYFVGFDENDFIVKSDKKRLQ